MGKNITFGFIAQDVQKVLPHVVTDDKVKSVKYLELIPICIRAIQEQQVIIQNEYKKRKDLEDRVKKLEQLIFK